MGPTHAKRKCTCDCTSIQNAVLRGRFEIATGRGRRHLAIDLGHRPPKRFEEFLAHSQPVTLLSELDNPSSLQLAVTMLSCRSILPFLGYALFAEGFVSMEHLSTTTRLPSSASSTMIRRRAGSVTQMPVSSSRGPPPESLNPASDDPTAGSPSALSSSSPTVPPPPAAAAATSRRKQIVMSKALPFLRCPGPLADCDYAGNAGFDPLGLASSREQLAEYREAEVKHARLAMLVRRRFGEEP